MAVTPKDHEPIASFTSLRRPFDSEGEEQDPWRIAAASYKGQVRADGESYYKIPVVRERCA